MATIKALQIGKFWLPHC